MNSFNYIFVIIINSLIIYVFALQYFDYPLSFTLDSIYKPTITSTIKSECPFIIHQIVPDINDVPSGLYHTILNNIRLNPEFEYRIYDYNSAFNILKKDFDINAINAYNASDLNQIKTDYIKLAFIYKYGGIFIDIKNIVCCKLTDLLEINNVYFVHNLSNNTMDLSLLVSHPNNEGIQNAFKVATEQLIKHDYAIDHLEITSGRVLGNELFYLGYLSSYALLTLDKDVVRFRDREDQKIVLKIYKSYEKENYAKYLLPDISLDWKEKIIYM